MFVLVNGKIVSCDNHVKKMLLVRGYVVTAEGSAQVLQFRNSITNLDNSERVITENNRVDIVNELLSICGVK